MVSITYIAASLTIVGGVYILIAAMFDGWCGRAAFGGRALLACWLSGLWIGWMASEFMQRPAAAQAPEKHKTPPKIVVTDHDDSIPRLEVRDHP